MNILESYLRYLNELSPGLHTFGNKSKRRQLIHNYRAVKDVQYQSCTNHCRGVYGTNQVERRNCLMKCIYDHKKRYNQIEKQTS